MQVPTAGYASGPESFSLLFTDTSTRNPISAPPSTTTTPMAEMINHFGVRLGAGLGAYPGVIP
ncbi:hypothetical protein FMUAM8_11340 [Nocardia cyriacigeorgica]|nr:hypothetical protein FMUAM8_11340 [Nocardia cyriacigeorgica]